MIIGILESVNNLKEQFFFLNIFVMLKHSMFSAAASQDTVAFSKLLILNLSLSLLVNKNIVYIFHTHLFKIKCKQLNKVAAINVLLS